jgi:hypothetical protein
MNTNLLTLLAADPPASRLEWVLLCLSSCLPHLFWVPTDSFISNWVGQSVTAFGINGSKCHTVTIHPNFLGRNVRFLGYAYNPSTLNQNVTALNSHSRWFVWWMIRFGRNATGSIRCWTNCQGTSFTEGSR